MPKKPGPSTKRLDPEKARSFAACGATNEQIAAALGVSKGTLFNARKRDKALDDAIETGKDQADLAVVAALYRKAIGYETVANGKKVWMAGDTTAMIFWLKNRRPKEWRDRQQIDGNLTLSGKLSLVEFKKSMKDCGDAASRD